MQKSIMTKKLIVLLVVITMLFSITACSKTDGEAETIELSLAHFFPATHPAETVFVQGWIKAIDEATNGVVKITSYPGGTLLQAADTYNGVVEGVADIGLSCFSYTRGRFPVLEAFELPGITYKNSKVASKVAWDGIQQLNPAEVQDTKLMMVIATGPGDLFTKDPIRSLADLKGYEIRATGLSATTIEALGGIPIGMPQSDAYEALSKGIVKGNLSPVEVLKGWKHAEVTDYLTLTPFLYNTLFFVTMNSDKWASIPADLQKIILETTDKFYNETGIGLWDMQNEEGMDYAVNEQGMEVIELSDAEKALWIEKVAPIQDTYTQSVKDLTSGTDVLKLVKELADKYNGIY
ncbi:MAG: TRAP transporter substrate-binding protein [Clostridia bacterium]|nr:TRAP transporter substrate-binding protein [Clostridia bacterium]